MSSNPSTGVTLAGPQIPLEVLEEIVKFVDESFNSQPNSLPAGSGNVATQLHDGQHPGHTPAPSPGPNNDTDSTTSVANSTPLHALPSVNDVDFRSSMKRISLVNPTFHQLCRKYIFREIDVGLGKDRMASIERLNNLSKLLQDRPSLARLVRSLTGVFPNPCLVSSDNDLTIPNINHSLTQLLNLPLVQSLTIAGSHDENALCQDPYRCHKVGYPQIFPYRMSQYGRETILGRYITQLTSLTLKNVEEIPILDIFSSPTLITLVLDKCVIPERSVIPSPHALAMGFNIREYHGKGTTGNSPFLLSLCANLQRVYFDCYSEYQPDDYELLDVAQGVSYVWDKVAPFNELVEAHFAGEIHHLNKFFMVAHEMRILEFPKLTHLVHSIDTDDEILDVHGFDGLNEPHVIFSHLPALLSLHLSGQSVCMLILETCLRPCHATLKSLRIDWAHTYVLEEGRIVDLHEDLDSLSTVINDMLVLRELNLYINLEFNADEQIPVPDLSEFALTMRRVFVEDQQGSLSTLSSLNLNIGLSLYRNEEDEILFDGSGKEIKVTHKNRAKVIREYRNWLEKVAKPTFEAQIGVIGDDAVFTYNSNVYYARS
ncbi:hypothetical protein CVT24_003927 [Panaeolus cyanescens]|uniref:F-box domain-containing protein n=1 Tax=Panaeolus cyanescens TaxID=181874 RepID=A0A409W850_9AGAR|nr:hypothetical protein CVT24_003927 [Panaeolus cyanescens]